MKRSEMLDLIAKTIVCQDSGFTLSIAEADILLKEMESVGMMPPENYDGQHGIMLNFWESEDEEE
jgi:hypothetical protein